MDRLAVAWQSMYGHPDHRHQTDCDGGTPQVFQCGGINRTPIQPTGQKRPPHTPSSKEVGAMHDGSWADFITHLLSKCCVGKDLSRREDAKERIVKRWMNEQRNYLHGLTWGKDEGGEVVGC